MWILPYKACGVTALCDEHENEAFDPSLSPVPLSYSRCACQAFCSLTAHMQFVQIYHSEFTVIIKKITTMGLRFHIDVHNSRQPWILLAEMTT